MTGRFAPSPTGRMHLGNIFTALLAWLSVRSQGGRMLLRIEDLDPQRSRAAYAEQLRRDLGWLGLDWDGEMPPQSTRSPVYAAHFAKLEEQGLIYPCYCSRSELHDASAPHASDGTVLYSGACRDLTPEQRAAKTRRPAWRVRVPDIAVSFRDGVCGPQTERLAETCGDFIVRRSDGVYAYQLAVVCDDALGSVTEVVRGSDLLGSTARQLWLFSVFGYPAPQYYHVPLLVAPDGRRLSKRERDLDIEALRTRCTPYCAIMKSVSKGSRTSDIERMNRMFKIVRKKELNSAVTLMEIEAPFVAKKAKAGQFIIFRVDETGERVPLTIAGYDREKGTVAIIFQKVGLTTKMLGAMNEGDYIQDFVGPLGKPTNTEGIKRVCVVGGGVGCAIALPSAQAFKEAGAEVDVIVGFRSKDIVILEDEFKACSDHLYLMTDDGSYGEHGFVTVKLQQLLEAGTHYDEVLAIGPIPMMKFVSKTTEPFGVKTTVSLNPIMVDGTGMCGGCRVTVGGEVKFACVDGPDFDGHKVDYAELMNRNGVYRDQEAENEKTHMCRMDKLAHELIR